MKIDCHKKYITINIDNKLFKLKGRLINKRLFIADTNTLMLFNNFSYYLIADDYLRREYLELIKVNVKKSNIIIKFK